MTNFAKISSLGIFEFSLQTGKNVRNFFNNLLMVDVAVFCCGCGTSGDNMFLVMGGISLQQLLLL